MRCGSCWGWEEFGRIQPAEEEEMIKAIESSNK